MSQIATYSQLKARQRQRNLVLLLLLLPAIYFSAVAAKVDLGIFWRNNLRTLVLLADLLRPDWTVLPVMVKAAAETLLVALLGTVLGSLLSFAFAVQAANNLSGRWANTVSRFLIALERSTSEIMIILLLIVVFGLGLFPGVLAIMLSCVGMLGKLYADAIEGIPTATLDAVRATGATKHQLIRYGVLPSIAPALWSNTILRLEINIRSSVMLGAIGAGGLGFELQKAYRYADYREMAVAILTILVLVFGAEQLSSWLRKRFLTEVKN